MGCFKLDPSLLEDAGVLAAGDAAIGAWVRMLSYSARYSTGGVIRPQIVQMVCAEDPTVIGKLQTAGLILDRYDDGSVLVLCRRAPSTVRALRLAAAAGRATRGQIAARVAFYGGLCWICRTAAGVTIDHVKPIARGGSNWPANLRPACVSCNSAKGARWPFRRPA